MKWFRKLMPREDRFFDLFARHSRTTVSAAEALNALLAGKDTQQHCERIIALEDEADDITREVLLAVRKSFITPFDRGDIKDLIMSMDDAIDMMHKTVKTIRLFEQTSFDPGMQEMGGVIVQAAKLVAEAIPLLDRMAANAQHLGVLTEEVVKVEGRSDELHDQGLKDLFRRHGATNPMAYIIGSEIYGELEKVVDRFEDVANEINGIVIENV
ncbi:putative pit accessory protein (plasmid) [Rhizobium favelukesii]|uniref:Pit accessory protein n=1 Tax=Rhizobium favelukesii TaxID=348824 RepID=W6RIT2_9HYPH|nr:putative pit accessory protein [Rhizobium favelukesii]